MAQDYDLVVIGTGVAGSTAAAVCRAAGWRVAIVDERPFGGTCALRGCDPKRVLLTAAAAVDAAWRLDGKGVAGGVTIDWPALMRFKRGFTDPVPEQRARTLAEQGIETICGHARFVAANRLRVGDGELAARHVVIATGAVPMPLGISGEEHLAASEDVLDLDRLPRHVTLVGGGFIAFEFAHLMIRAGVEVTMLERGERVLGPFDPDLVARLVAKSRRLGITVRTGAEVAAVEPHGEVYRLLVRSNGSEDWLETDLAVHAAGRVPSLAGLDLAAAGIDCERTIVLNDRLQSVSNPAVYVAGDAAGDGPPLTPVAHYHGRIVAANLLHGNRRPIDHRGVASVVFTLPPLAAVGLQEAAVHERGDDVTVKFQDMSGWYSVRRTGDDCAAAKTLVERDSGRILGAHLLGPAADELINLFALAVRQGLTADDLRDQLFTYPTAASDISYLL